MASFVDSALNLINGDVLQSKDGSKCSIDSLKNSSLIFLYFSAHWCGPCRSFTPQLAKKYEELKADGKEFEIVFVSSDCSKSDCDQYWSTQPWKLLDYSERDMKAALSKELGVRGIPSLIIFDSSSGKIVCEDGRSAIMEVEFDKLATYEEDKKVAEAEEERKFEELCATKPNRLDFIEGSQILTHDGPATSTETLKDNKIIGLYFSAHWCPPCRSFTPRLVKKYEELKKQGHSIEIVFVSSDQNEATFTEYWADMPWKALEFSQRDTKKNLGKVFDVSGIPALILLDENGKLLTTDGRTAIMASPLEKLRTFEADKAETAAKLEVIVGGLPDTITHDCHEHPLVKQRDPYGPRGWGCDVCDGVGDGWAYRCVECRFDAHPKCVCEMPAMV